MTFEEINHCVGIVEVNNYQIHDPGSAGYRGVFPLTSLISHSCAPNVRLAIERRGNCSNRAIAAVDIEKGVYVSSLDSYRFAFSTLMAEICPLPITKPRSASLSPLLEPLNSIFKQGEKKNSPRHGPNRGG